MKIFAIICGFLFVSASAVALYAWARPHEIRHHTESELIGLSCAEISEKNEEIIFAYHDASIEKHKRTGSFEGGVGLPEEDVLPFIILMKRVIQDHDLMGLDLSRPFFHSPSVSTPKIHSEFYTEITRVCAKNPSRDAIEAMVQAAKNLKLTREPENS